jgi:hypothetical protein
MEENRMPKDNQTKVNLRFDVELRRQVEDLAEAAERSLNGEIVWRLRNSLKQAGCGDQEIAENSKRRVNR